MVRLCVGMYTRYTCASTDVGLTQAQPNVEDREEEEMSMKYAEDRDHFDERITSAHKLADQLKHVSYGTDHVDLDDLQADIPLEHADTLDQLLHNLFSECDHAHDEKLSKIEMSPLVELLFDRRPDIARMYSYNIARMVADVMTHFDDDRSETLDFVEFTHLMACKPWLALIPTEMHHELHQRCEELGFMEV